MHRSDSCSFVQQTKPLLRLSVVLMTVGCSAYAVGALCQWPSLSSSVWLIAARCITGGGSAVGIYTVRYFLLETSAPRDMPNTNLQSTFYTMLGIGSGPMAASLATQIIGAMRSGDQLVGEQVAVASLQLVSCLALFIGLQLLPCRHAISLHVSLATEAVLTEQHSVSQCVQQFAVLCCVAVSGMRAMVVSGLEVATAMVLESVYGWGLPCIGWCISTSFSIHSSTAPLQQAQVGSRCCNMGSHCNDCSSTWQLDAIPSFYHIPIW